MTSYALRGGNPARSRADAVVVGLLPGAARGGQAPEVASGGEAVAKAYGRRFAPLLSSLGLTGRAGEIAAVPTAGAISSPLLVLVGLGPRPSPAACRRAAGAAARAVRNAASVALALPADSPEHVRAVVEGFRLGGYAFTAYKSSGGGADRAAAPGVAEVAVLSPVARRKEAVTAFEEGQLVALAVARARDWVNTPANDLTPPAFADAVVAAAKELGRGRGPKVGVTVLDEDELARRGFGGLLGVGGGSAAPPRLVELSYRPRRANGHLALVGKGITFDSGGLTIKPAQSMATMKCDMAGAAAVVQATFAIAQLGLPVRVSGYAAMAENMLSGTAMRPGDVLTIYGGTTVEVLNTDAEGRLVLADALVRAAEQQPDVVVEVATLTGHMVVALGDQLGGVMGDDEIVRQVLAAAERAGEDLWPMPIPEGMDERIRSSSVADLAQHDWVRWGGGLFAAAFLQQFTGGRPWAHLDIAGPAFNSGGPRGHLTAGGTGFAVATLVELARELADGS